MTTARDPRRPHPIDAVRPPAADPAHHAPAISSPLPRCRLAGWSLQIPPFRIERHAQTYLSPSDCEIDLRVVGPGRYRVLAVHNFHVEDRNPDLGVCVAGVFLAALRSDGAWEEPERFPVECRTLELLGVIEVGPADRPPRWV
ncbi:MAG: hypothetical protein ACXWCV_03540 [Caldimonas sp.]